MTGCDVGEITALCNSKEKVWGWSHPDCPLWPLTPNTPRADQERGGGGGPTAARRYIKDGGSLQICEPHYQLLSVRWEITGQNN